jgi:hypothetical protein
MKDLRQRARKSGRSDGGARNEHNPHVAVVAAVLLSWCVSSLLLAVPLGRAIYANFSGRLIGGRLIDGAGDGRSDDDPRGSFARADSKARRAHSRARSED